MAALDPQALLEPEVSPVLWDSLDPRVPLYVFHPFTQSSKLGSTLQLMQHFFYSLQGEAGKPGERGVMGAIGAPVSVNVHSL